MWEWQLHTVPFFFFFILSLFICTISVSKTMEELDMSLVQGFGCRNYTGHLVPLWAVVLLDSHELRKSKNTKQAPAEFKFQVSESRNFRDLRGYLKIQMYSMDISCKKCLLLILNNFLILHLIFGYSRHRNNVTYLETPLSSGISARLFSFLFIS